MNNTDKRSMVTDALKTLGTIISTKEKRDAIHLAVEPVQAAEDLRPGQNIGLNNLGHASAYAKPHLGIVDPFLKEEKVFKGQMFWLIVYPRQITSLRHVWTHPAFENEKKEELDEDKIEETMQVLDTGKTSKQWLQHFADENRIDYDEMMVHARYYLEDGDYWIEGGRFEGINFPPEFWVWYERVTKEKVPEDKRWSFFSCSC